jgi:hypothetical protein
VEVMRPGWALTLPATNTKSGRRYMVLWCVGRCIVAPYSSSATLAYPWNQFLSVPQVSINQHGKQ